jgi:hypothetical protein
VPVLPWSLAGPLLKVLPTAWFAPRRRAGRSQGERPKS